MAYLPVSAFQRPLTHAQLDRAERASAMPRNLPGINKWALLRALVKAKDQFGVTARDLALLQGLLSFYPHDRLQSGQDMVLFPSNRAICERMNGMPDSTMRRHLRNLIAAGLLLRRDSHNGKRFTVVYGGDRLAFGFDLSPLIERAGAIHDAAAAQEEAEQEARQIRLDIQLMRRDLFAMIALLPAEAAAQTQLFWGAVGKSLRRKQSVNALQALHADHTALLKKLKAMILNSSDVQNEQHIQSSNKEYYESKKDGIEEVACDKQRDLRLETVLQACPEISTYYDRPISQWSRLIEATNQIYRAIGVTDSVHRDAVKTLGAEQTAVVLAALLQRFDKIRAPGAYLRTLVAKAAIGKFSCRPMIMALMPQGI